LDDYSFKTPKLSLPCAIYIKKSEIRRMWKKFKEYGYLIIMTNNRDETRDASRD
jgi:hypothetical protein